VLGEVRRVVIVDLEGIRLVELFKIDVIVGQCTTSLDG
jgi:hypothetical protein